MDQNFTDRLGAWLEAPAEARDYAEGNMMLLQLSGNRIQYNNLSRNPAANGEYIERKLRRYHNFRLQQLTHEQVTDLKREANTIVASLPEKKEERMSFGKRPDHDLLPDEIRAMYEENFSLMAQIRELHLQARMTEAAAERQTCPDSEVYPFVKEIVALDKKRVANWQAYDSYTGTPAPKAKKKKA